MSAGKVVFSGKIKDAITHFSSVGMPCPELTNPSDFWLDMITLDYRDETALAKSQERIQTLQDTWEKHTSTIASTKKRIEDAPVVWEPMYWNNGAINEFMTLLERDFSQEIVRNVPNVLATIMHSLTTTIMVMALDLFGCVMPLLILRNSLEYYSGR